MTILVRQAQSWKEFKKAWINGMNRLHWFKENKPFDYNCKEELQELRQNFGKPSSILLVAKIL